MNNLLQPPMPRMQPQMQSALVQAMPGAPQPQSATPQNALQAPPQGEPSTPGPGIIPAPPSFSPEQVQQAHEHLHDMQETLNNLLKVPDHELNTKSLFRAAADMVTKHQLHSGKRGIPAAAIASELSSPDFPKADTKGNPPDSAAIRAYLQNHFDQAVMTQAKLTQKFGASIPHVTQENQSQ